MSEQSRVGDSRLLGIFTSLLLAIGFVWALLNYQLIIDYYFASTFQPSSGVVQLAEEVKMTEKATFLLRASQAQLDDRNSFNTHCSKMDADSVVLGCYVGPQHLYVYNITDQRLEGVRQVTIAHEMLHAAYDRLEAGERDRVNKLLEAELPKAQAASPELAERLKTYEKTEPGERDNELHSILGTEVMNLSPELETYYKQYFTDRSVVAQFAIKYTSIFVELKNNQTQLVNELKNLKIEIDNLTASYNAGLASLNADIDSFNARASAQGGFSSQAEFEATRSGLMAHRDQLENDRARINSKVDEYNSKRQQLEALNVQAENLNSQLDSSKLPSLQ